MSELSMFQMLKKHRGAVYVSAAVNVGSVLFGFDTGVASATVALASFKKDFHLVDPSHPSKLAYTSGNIVALLTAGAFFGAIVPPLITKWVGRRHLLAIAGIFFLIGGILQTAAQPPGLSMIYGGRVLAGFGVGIISNTAPVFVAESAPKHLRGVMMSVFELFLVSGGMLAYWSVYGCSVHLAPTSVQWRTTLSLQIILASIVLASSLFIPESPRWLAKQGKWDQCIKSLCFLRGAKAGDREIVEEVAEIKAQIEEEIAMTNGRTVKELFLKKNFQRLCWGLSVAVFAIWEGHNAILYYGPSVFAQIGFTSQNSSLLATGVFTVVKVVCTIFFVGGTVHIFKRKTLLIVGAFFMGTFLLALGAVLSTHPPSKGSNESASGKAMMALIYLFVVAYSLSWGPLQWIYMGEIFPTRLRDYGMAACAMMIWLMNYVVTKIAPIAILNIGWKTWMIFGTVNIAASLFSWFLPETKDLSLEEMDILFGVVEEGVRVEDIRKDVEEKIRVQSNVYKHGSKV